MQNFSSQSRIQESGDLTKDASLINEPFKGIDLNDYKRSFSRAMSVFSQPTKEIFSTSFYKQFNKNTSYFQDRNPDLEKIKPFQKLKVRLNFNQTIRLKRLPL